MNVNDSACFLNKRAALESIASKLAPTVITIRGKRPKIAGYFLVWCSSFFEGMIQCAGSGVQFI
ncbi:hypothetical protein PS691_05239 [Pseudomonas fluorescens]|uniref:Uncharacterized protein n=1 Tax=Pseudomonas fluorescens TaxID=294 RepID=A0A5E7F641_PSEFL|nr:hypothetical protein PS691_05239 [Pseudomonas fluorescens]